MGESAPASDRPRFFLRRDFLGEQDLAILVNTTAHRLRLLKYGCAELVRSTNQEEKRPTSSRTGTPSGTR